MAIDGVNSQQNVKGAQTAKASAEANAQASAKAASQALQSALNGADRKASEQNETMTPNERKAWIKDYQAAHNCSKKEAKEAFDKEFGKIDRMPHKDAKAWVKNYMEQKGCTKKEAKAAFKEQFGYNMPLSRTTQQLRSMLLAFNPLTNIGTTIDGVTGRKLGLLKFATGRGNNDAKYEKRSYPDSNYYSTDKNTVNEK